MVSDLVAECPIMPLGNPAPTMLPSPPAPAQLSVSAPLLIKDASYKGNLKIMGVLLCLLTFVFIFLSGIAFYVSRFI